MSKSKRRQTLPKHQAASKRKRKEREHFPSQRRSTSPAMLVAVAVVVVAGVAAVATAVVSQRRSDQAVKETWPVSIEGTGLPTMPVDATKPDPAIGMIIPTVRGHSFDGQPISIVPGSKAKVILFLAHWCPHCQAEVPRIVEWTKSLPLPPEVEVVSVSTGVNRGAQNYPPSRWLQREGWPFPVIADDEANSCQRAFGVEGYPTFVVVSREGKVLGRSSGEIILEQWKSILSTAATA